MFPNRLAPKVPNDMLKNPPFCSFGGFFSCFRDSFQQNIRIFKSLNDFHYVIHSLFEIIEFAVPEPCIFLKFPASIAKAAAVIPNGAKMHFLASFFVLLPIIIHEADHFHQAFLNSLSEFLLFSF